MTHRILVIDDEPDIREITALTLERLAGWEVLTAANGTDGARLALEERPEAVLLDVMMPEVDGEATARLIRADDGMAQLPIVLLSAAPQLPDWATDLAVLALVAKPFDPMGLPGRLRAELGWD